MIRQERSSQRNGAIVLNDRDQQLSRCAGNQRARELSVRVRLVVRHVGAARTADEYGGATRAEIRALQRQRLSTAAIALDDRERRRCSAADQRCQRRRRIRARNSHMIKVAENRETVHEIDRLAELARLRQLHLLGFPSSCSTASSK